jgi:hypothetical protein
MCLMVIFIVCLTILVECFSENIPIKVATVQGCHGGMLPNIDS